MKKSLLILVLIPFLLLSCDTDPKPPEYTGPGTLEITLTGELAGDYLLFVQIGPDELKDTVKSSPAVWEVPEGDNYFLPWVSIYAFKDENDDGEYNDGEERIHIHLEYEARKQNQYILEVSEIDVKIAITDSAELCTGRDLRGGSESA